MRVHLLDTGHCRAWEHHLVSGGRHRLMDVPSIAALIEHPRQGFGLFDTGYAPRILTAAARFPYRLYQWVTPMTVPADRAASAQLAKLGVAPRDVRWIVISHFHADHIAGLRDFPNARLYATRAAFDEVRERSGIPALMRAYLPALLPDDFAERAQLLDAFAGEELHPFGPTHDLFGDGSIRLVPLPGHARGQIGALVQSETGAFLLSADACWLSRGYRELRNPHWLTRLIADDSRQTRSTLKNLHAFSARTGLRIVPTHCPEALHQWARQ